MKDKKKIFAWLLLISWLILIFSFSSQNGQSSSGLSNGLLKTLENILHLPLTSSFFSFFIRKLAHFSLYFILALLTINLEIQYCEINKKQILIALFFCLIYAIGDEIHQSFVGGRSPKIMDVLIDFSGSLMYCIIYYLLKKHRQVNYKE